MDSNFRSPPVLLTRDFNLDKVFLENAFHFILPLYFMALLFPFILVCACPSCAHVSHAHVVIVYVCRPGQAVISVLDFMHLFC